jgi:hypothetical protein
MNLDKSLTSSSKAEKIEYFILHGSWDNSWVTTCFCRQCGLTFGPETEYNVYKLKGLFFCGPCFETLVKKHVEKGVILNAELYWDSLQSSPELQ